MYFVKRLQLGTNVTDADERAVVTHALDLILEDKQFKEAPKSSAFLRYVVTQTLAGNADRIKAYSIAIDVLGMPVDFDPKIDPSIRILAKRVRVMLNNYYSRTTDHKIIVQLKPSTYIPEFVLPAAHKLFDFD